MAGATHVTIRLMDASGWRPDSAVMTAMVCAGVLGAQHVAGKAASDALFLSRYDVTSLPAMIVATSLFSIFLVAAASKGLRGISPATHVPVAFGVGATLLLAEWGLTAVAPNVVAPVVYLQVSGLGPVLASGFWLIATERFDPHTAKKRFAQIAGGGTLGGVLGGLLAARVATMWGAEAILPLLAALQLACAWQIRRFTRQVLGGGRPLVVEQAPALSPEPTPPVWRALSSASYLRTLAALVLLGTMAAILVDYVFKAQAKAAFGGGAELAGFFSLYYAAISLMTFVAQASSSRLAIEKFGLAFTTGAPSLALLVGGCGALVAPSLTATVLARGGESVFRGSLFRSGYELCYTPIPPNEKRVAKSIIDVGFDRLGDAIGAGLIQIILLLPAAGQSPAMFILAIGCSGVALVFASRLQRGYIQTLERNLLNRALELDLSEVEDQTTRTAILRTLRRPETGAATGRSASVRGEQPERKAQGPPSDADSEMQEITALRSQDSVRILRVLRREEGLAAPLVPHVIRLLAWDSVSDEAVDALRKIAEERIGELTDALVDPHQPFAVRRRLARVFAVCVSQRAADGLLQGLDDLRFEVRFQCGRSLAAILEKNPRITIDARCIHDIVQREATVSRPVWEGRRLLDGLGDSDHRSFLEEVVMDRASQSLAHVFTLLSLVLPAEPLRIAFRGLHTEDRHLRGTALEYLEGVLPPAICDRLWPFLEDRRPVRHAARPGDEVLRDLLQSSQSIVLNLEALKRRHGATKPRV